MNKHDASTRSKSKRQNRVAHETIDSFETRHAPSLQIHISSNPQDKARSTLAISPWNIISHPLVSPVGFLFFLFSFFLFPTRRATTILSQLRALQSQFIPSTRNQLTNRCSHLVNPPKFFTVSLIKGIPSERNFHTFAGIDCDYRVTVQSIRGIRRESMETRNKSSICRSIKPTLNSGFKEHLQTRHTCMHTHTPRWRSNRFAETRKPRIYFPSKCVFVSNKNYSNKRSERFFVCQWKCQTISEVPKKGYFFFSSKRTALLRDVLRPRHFTQREHPRTI